MLFRSQVNELQKFNQQQKLKQQLVTKEVQIRAVGDPTGGQIELESIPMLYITVEYGQSSSSISDDDPYIRGRKVKIDGEASGPVEKFKKLAP